MGKKKSSCCSIQRLITTLTTTALGFLLSGEANIRCFQVEQVEFSATGPVILKTSKKLLQFQSVFKVTSPVVQCFSKRQRAVLIFLASP